MFAAMKLTTYRKEQNLSQVAFAERMRAAGFECTQSLVSQWEQGAVDLSAERCAQIEQVTRGAVTRVDLRPDLFGPLPELPEAAAPASLARVG